MPRFYFDVRDEDGTTHDPDGLEYDTLADAIADAKKALHEMALDEPADDHSAVVIDIRDENQSLVTVVASTTILPRSSKGGRPKG